jgi:hypothetical protein
VKSGLLGLSPGLGSQRARRESATNKKNRCRKKETNNNGGPIMSDVQNAPLAGADNSVILPPPFDSESEEALALRYGRKISRHQELVYEFTRDPGLLHQYYGIREQEFKAIYNAPRYSGIETEHDRKGYILVVRQGNFCVGGVRIVMKSSRHRELLPMEIKDFRIEQYFPYLAHTEASYGQASWFSILPEFRSNDVVRKMIHRICAKTAALNGKMLFCVAPILNSRLYMRHLRALGLSRSEIHMNIELPAYPSIEEIKLYLVSSEINKLSFNKDASSDEVESKIYQEEML